MDFGTALKNFWSDSVRVVNKAATGVASATRYKMDEMGSMSRRRELVKDLGEKVVSLAQSGVEFPDEIAVMLKEIQDLENGLAELRSDRAAAKAAAAETAAAEKAERSAARAEAKAMAAEAKAAAKAALAETEAAAKEAKAMAAAAAETVEETAEEPIAPVLEVEPEVDDGPVCSGEMPTAEDAPSLVVEEKPAE